jgi:hypothetical protein
VTIAGRNCAPEVGLPKEGLKTYRVVAISLNAQQATEADRLTDALRSAGWPRANRSLVLREALLLLCDELAGRGRDEIFRYFMERHATRAAQANARQ